MHCKQFLPNSNHVDPNYVHCWIILQYNWLERCHWTGLSHFLPSLLHLHFIWLMREFNVSPCIAQCFGGYFCNSGSSVPTQNNCTASNFCRPGSSVMTTCPAGTFCPTTGLSAAVNCTGGFFCSTSGLTAVSGQCNAGSFCTTAAVSATQSTCTRGSFCPARSVVPTIVCLLCLLLYQSL